MEKQTTGTFDYEVAKQKLSEQFRTGKSLFKPDFAVEKNKVILSLLNKISIAKQLDFSSLSD